MDKVLANQDVGLCLHAIGPQTKLPEESWAVAQQAFKLLEEIEKVRQPDRNIISGPIKWPDWHRRSCLETDKNFGICGFSAECSMQRMGIRNFPWRANTCQMMISTSFTGFEGALSHT